MKKIRILSVLTLLLTVTMLFTACGKGSASAVSSFDKVLNPDYDVSKEVVVTGKQIDALDGYLPLRYLNNDSILPTFDLWGLEIFYNLDAETGDMSYKVYSLLNNKVILTLDASDVDYDFDTQYYDSYGLLIVAETVYTEAENPEDALEETTYYAYDAMGKEIAKTDDKDGFDAPFTLGDMVVFEMVAYDVDDETGLFTKEMEIPEYVLIDDEDIYMEWNDEYYYVKTERSVFVYDHSFNYVSAWVAPSYVSVHGIFVLNNGDVMIQYANELDEEAKEFDYYTTQNRESVKYDLVTLIMRAKNGNVKDVDMKYIVSYVMTNQTLYDEQDDNNMFNDSFDNVAWVYPIVNQRVDRSAAAEDVVLMSDKGKIKKSLKLVDGQIADIPEKIADDVYVVEMLHGGYALVNLDGDVLKMINSGADMRLMGQYLVSETKIYDLNLEVIYNLKENDATLLEEIDGVLFVQEGDEDEYTVYSFCGGAKKTVYSYSAEAEENDEFYTTSMGYVLIDSEGTHTYYNANGKELLTTDGWLQVLNSAEDEILCAMIPSLGEDWEAKYYIFTK